MKVQKLLKNSLLAFICCLIISSCSQSRYGSLSKVKVDKPLAKTEKKHEVLENKSIKSEQPFFEEKTENKIESDHQDIVRENYTNTTPVEKNKVITSDKFRKSKISELVKVPVIQKIFKSPNKTISKTQTVNKADGERMSGLALAGFICGVIGFILTITIGWSIFLGTLATIFSAIGLSETINGEKRGKGLAIAGLVLGILCITLFWVLVGSL